jgi:hypothetical protein
MRVKEMREQAVKTGWPHLLDPMKTYDLDRQAGMTDVFRDGRKVREEPVFEIMPSRPPRQVEIDVSKS